MRNLDRWIGASLGFLALAMVPVTGFGDEPARPVLYDCGERICSDWAPEGENTCRSCTTAQCREQNGDELLAGHKKQTECFEGYGDPPKDSSE
jgi:hypothetical protein